MHLLHGWWVASCPDCGHELGRSRDQETAERAGERRRCPICQPERPDRETQLAFLIEWIAANRGFDDLTGAKTTIERALAIEEASFGFRHPSLAAGLNNLGLVQRDLGDLTRAKASLERALAIFTDAYGAEHEDTQTVARNLQGLRSPVTRLRAALLSWASRG